MSATGGNIDEQVVRGFGDEWTRFDQSALSDAELRAMYDPYFAIFSWDALPHDAAGFDAGCGTGRWARFVAPRVGRILCVDASEDALNVARRNLASSRNAEFVHAPIERMPIADASLDFGYSLGVLHHLPDTAAAIRTCVAKLKPGAPFLIYLYYAFDNRPLWFKAIWRASELIRTTVSRLPHALRYAISQLLAAVVYWPLARLARRLERAGKNVANFPLAYYRDRSFYVMRNDALDRFGTKLEQRFTRAQIERMLRDAGLERIRFSDAAPYWCAVGFRGVS